MTGIAVSDQDRLLGMGGVGAAIYDHNDSVIAAISFSGMRPTILDGHDQFNRELIAEVATTISRQLGASLADSRPIGVPSG